MSKSNQLFSKKKDISRRQLAKLIGALGATVIMANSAVVLAASCGGQAFPDVKQVGSKKLVLNGLGIREATIFKVDVYVAGLYVEKKSSNSTELIKSTQVRHMDLHLVRNVSAEELNDAIEKSFKKGTGAQFSKYKERMVTFKKMIPNLKDGQEIAFTMAPGKGTEVLFGGKSRGRIPGDDFAEVLMSLWLGDNPPNPGLKKGLLGKGCG
jgi:hypothetical protein